MPSVCSGSELAEELEELEELDEEELDELAELEAGELLGWLVEFEGAGAPPPPPPAAGQQDGGCKGKACRGTGGNVPGFGLQTHKITPFLFYQSIAGRGLGPVKSIIEY